jgi:O-antigen ligase
MTRNSFFFKTNILLLPFVALLVILPFPGTVALRLLCLVSVFVVALFLCFRKPDIYRNFPPGRIGIAVWVLICSLSLFYSTDTDYTMKELKNEIVYTMIVFFSFFVAGQDQQRAQILLRSLALGLLLIGGIALYAWFKNGFYWQEESTHGGVGSFSTYVVTCMPALFWLSLEDSSLRWRWLSRVLVGFATVLAFITLQRAVWPALLVELLIALSLIQRNRKLRIGKRQLLVVMALLLVAAVVVFSFTNKLRGLPTISSLLPSTQTLNTPVAEQNGSDGDARLPYWPAILKTIADHPLKGAGFGQAMMKKAYPELVPPNYPALWHAHNVVLNYGIQMGLPGVLALLIMFLGFARHYWRSLHENPIAHMTAIAGIMLLAGVLLRNQTNDFFRRDMALLFWCLMGLFSALVLPRKMEP